MQHSLGVVGEYKWKSAVLLWRRVNVTMVLIRNVSVTVVTEPVELDMYKGN